MEESGKNINGIRPENKKKYIKLTTTSSIRKNYLISLVAWSFLIILVFLVLLNIIINKAWDEAELKANSIIDMNISLRHWASDQGGIYVPITDKTLPNKYLADIPERDIETPSGKKLTLMNPAYLLRQFNEGYQVNIGVTGHLTSLKPIRPENAPDEWERRTLIKLEKKEDTVIHEITVFHGKLQFRLMKGFITQKSCLNCHEQQGYKIGDLRGGISVSIPYDEIQTEINDRIVKRSSILAGLWIIGILFIIHNFRNVSKINNQLQEERNTLARTNEKLETYNEALIESELKYKSLVDTIPSGIVVHVEGVIVYANHSAAKLIGFNQPEEMLGKSALSFVHPNSRPFAIERIKKAIETGNKAELAEEVFIKVDGTPFDVEVIAVPILYNNKNAVQVVINEITDRKKAQKALETSERKFRESLENLNLIGLIIDIHGKIEYANKYFATFSGWSVDELIGLDWVENFIPSGELKEEIRNLLEVTSLSGHSEIYHQNEIILKNGDIRLINWANSVNFNLDGTIASTTSIGEDITIKNQLENELKETKQLLENILMMTTEGITLMTPNLSLKYVNDSAAKIIGYDSVEDLLTNFKFQDSKKKFDLIDEHFHEVPIEKLPDRIALELKTESSMILGYRFQENNILKWARITSKPILDENGELKYILNAITDITEIKKSYQELRESTEVLTAFFDNSPFGMGIFDTDLKYIKANKPLASINNMSSEDLIDKKFGDLLPSLQNKYESMFKNILFTGVPVLNYKGYIAPRENFEELYFNGTFFPIVNSESIISGIGIMIDITTEEMKIKIALSESEIKYKNLIDLMNEGLMQVDTEDRIMYVNNKLSEMFGFDKDELIGKIGHEQIVYKEDWDLVINQNLSRLEGQSNTYEIRMKKKNGELMYGIISGSPITNTEGSTVGSIGVITDITEKKLAEISIKESEEKFRSAFNTSPDGITIIDLESGLCIEANQAILEITGFEYDELVGSTASALKIWKHPEHRATLIDGLNKYGFINNIETEFIKRDGTYFAGLISARILTLNNRRCTIMITRDITERKEYELKLETARNKAEESDKLKSAFLANMSHEIRTPMNGIIGFAEMLRIDNKFSEEDKESLSIITKCGNQLLKIVNDILDISKLEVGQFRITERECNINKILTEMYVLMRAEIISKEKTIQLNISLLPKEFTANIITDEIRIRQILTNLISNAIKFTENGTIDISCKIIEENVLFEIRDTGIGIPSNQISSIFERFRQVELETSRKYGGTGLGLSIAKGLIELMNGKIWCESLEGYGSTFFFTIPYKYVDKKIEIEVNATNNSRINWTNYNFLIVDDDLISIQFLKKALAKTGAGIHIATTGKMGIEQFESIKDIDLVLLDIRLPDISGFEVLKRIREINSNIPVIAQTANAMAEDEAECMGNGFNGFLGKPIIYNMLIEKIIGII